MSPALHPKTARQARDRSVEIGARHDSAATGWSLVTFILVTSFVFIGILFATIGI